MHAGFCKQLFAAGIGGTRQRDEEYLSVYGILLSAGSIAVQRAAGAGTGCRGAEPYKRSDMHWRQGGVKVKRDG